MDLTHEEVQRILKIIEEAKHLEEFDLSYGDFQLHIRRHGSGRGQAEPSLASAPAPAAAEVVPPARAAPHPVPQDMVAIRAPMLGTFYRAPSPGEKPFVELGQSVGADDTVCLIEVMKLFNSIRAGVDGTVAEIRAQNGKLVEYEEVLIVIDPARR